MLKGIDLHMNKGEVVSIVGPSGAGKTTLLQIMGTLDKPDSGSITIDGTGIRSFERKGNKPLPQLAHRLRVPVSSAVARVYSPRKHHDSGIHRRQDEERGKRKSHGTAAIHGTRKRASHKPSELSGGEKQRVAVARALVNNPAVIFADEPSGSLDSKNKAELHQLFFNLRDRFGQTFVIVTHDEQLAKTTDRTIEMKDGQLCTQHDNETPNENKETETI